jgi:hypothetical protein
MILVLLVAVLLAPLFTTDAGAVDCARTITADVVALDQPYFLNRLGAVSANGMIYALKRDVVDKNTLVPCNAGGNCVPGNVALRPDKRPRPIVLRMNVGDCIAINFTNLLTPLAQNKAFIFNLNLDFNEPGFLNNVPDLPVLAADPTPAAVAFAPANIEFEDQPITREASIHVNGMQLFNSILDDGSFVGRNPSSLVAPGGSTTYTLYGEYENVYHLYSMGSKIGGDGGSGTDSYGLFGAIVVEPKGSEWYRSQITHEEMVLATCAPAIFNNLATVGQCFDKNQDGTFKNVVRTAAGQPVFNYDRNYPAVEPFIAEGKANLPILKFLQDTTTLVHSDLHAIVTGKDRGQIPRAASDDRYRSNSTNPQQNMPFREFASIWNDEQVAVQPFTQFYKDPVLLHTFKTVGDVFIINMASGGIGSEIVANRLGIGPQWDCVDCKAEEFFLTSWAIGDVGVLVDRPAVFMPFITGIPVGAGPGARASLFSDDPANVHHSYMGDHAKFRNVHAGPFEHHIFHLHGHQWVFAPQSDKANYMDMQQVSPGSGYTMDTVNGGSGNRHKTPGDAIYH